MPRKIPVCLQLAKIGQQLLMILDVFLRCRSILCSVSQQLGLLPSLRSWEEPNLERSAPCPQSSSTPVVRCWLGHGNRHMYRSWDRHSRTFAAVVVDRKWLDTGCNCWAGDFFCLLDTSWWDVYDSMTLSWSPLKSRAHCFDPATWMKYRSYRCWTQPCQNICFSAGLPVAQRHFPLSPCHPCRSCLWPWAPASRPPPLWHPWPPRPRPRRPRASVAVEPEPAAWASVQDSASAVWLPWPPWPWAAQWRRHRHRWCSMPTTPPRIPLL